MRCVRLVLNTATGQIVQRMDYDAFWQVLADTAPNFGTSASPAGSTTATPNWFASARATTTPKPAGGRRRIPPAIRREEVRGRQRKKIAKKVACKKLNLPGVNNPGANKEREELKEIFEGGRKGTWSLWESLKGVFSGLGK